MAFNKQANMNRVVTVARNYGIGGAAPTLPVAAGPADPLPVLQARVRAAFTAAQRFSNAAGTRRLTAGEAAEWERLTGGIKAAKAALATAQAEAARPSAAAAAMGVVLGQVAKKAGWRR